MARLVVAMVAMGHPWPQWDTPWPLWTTHWRLMEPIHTRYNSPPTASGAIPGPSLVRITIVYHSYSTHQTPWPVMGLPWPLMPPHPPWPSTSHTQPILVCQTTLMVEIPPHGKSIKLSFTHSWCMIGGPKAPKRGPSWALPPPSHMVTPSISLYFPKIILRSFRSFLTQLKRKPSIICSLPRAVLVA